MPSLKALRKRIATVRSTQQITKAMKMVSAAKLRRAQDAAERARPYAEKLAEMFTAVTGMGALLIRYSSALATDKFFVPVILLALLGVALSSAVEKLQKRLAPWKETERAL